MSLDSSGWARIGASALGAFAGGPAGGQLAGSLLGGAMGGSAPAGKSSADVIGSGLDASGWAINFSGVQNASSSPSKNAASGAEGGYQRPLGSQPSADWVGLPFVDTRSSMTAGGSNATWIALAGLGLVVLWRLKK